MTTLLNRTGSTMTVGDAFTRVFGPTATVRFEAFDGSATGPVEAPLHLELRSKRGLDYLLTAPSTLGLARAYLQGDLVLEPIDEGNPYDVLRYIEDNLAPSKPSLRELPELARFFRIYRPQIHEIPKEETPGQLRRLARGFTHGRVRDAEAIHHHYDVSNRFYELLLGPSMAYTCAVYPTLDATLEEAQEEKFDLVCRKLELRPGMRLLDVGCGWGGMVRHAVLHYGVTAIGVTLSKEQASWGAERMAREGLDDRGDIRHGDYRDVAEGGFDAVSSIGLTEHIGVANYPAYFRFLREQAAGRRSAAEPLHHPPRQPAPGHPVARVHQPLRVPGRWPHRLGRHRHGHGGPGLRGAPPREPARALRDDDPGLEQQPVGELGRRGGRGRSQRGAGLGSVPRRVAAVVRAQPDPAPPGARLEDDGAGRVRVRAAADLGQLT